eukprot:gnl/Hemi2/19819_TR6568_c0_g1_i1.p1 gnl/Hemi2/19819_TR6568_c0_g1~~gnl/Hemi2/19819_TR6568_c0_g1_i1.p1  ORF type:complete len:363 (+),score=29.18 gnl/Hemi2/19819_TR6568_c0_g1_i1:91-1179(+)
MNERAIFRGKGFNAFWGLGSMHFCNNSSSSSRKAWLSFVVVALAAVCLASGTVTDLSTISDVELSLLRPSQLYERTHPRPRQPPQPATNGDGEGNSNYEESSSPDDNFEPTNNISDANGEVTDDNARSEEEEGGGSAQLRKLDSRGTRGQTVLSSGMNSNRFAGHPLAPLYPSPQMRYGRQIFMNRQFSPVASPQLYPGLRGSTLPPAGQFSQIPFNNAMPQRPSPFAQPVSSFWPWSGTRLPLQQPLQPTAPPPPPPHQLPPHLQQLLHSALDGLPQLQQMQQQHLDLIAPRLPTATAQLFSPPPTTPPAASPATATAAPLSSPASPPSAPPPTPINGDAMDEYGVPTLPQSVKTPLLIRA